MQSIKPYITLHINNLQSKLNYQKSLEIIESILEFYNTKLLAKSFTLLLFKHITKENREVSVAFGEAELMSDVGTLMVVP